MKPRVLLSILCILFMMSSCTSENDILNDMASQDKADTQTTLSFSIKNETTTKVGIQAPSNSEATIKNVMYFLLEGDDVIGIQNVTAGNTPCTFTTKKGKTNLSVIAVVNTSAATASELANKTTRQGIKGISLNETDLNEFIKFGDQPVDLASTNNEVIVSQVAARIDLANLTVNIQSANGKNVVLKSVELKNRNTNGKLDMKAQTLIAGNKTENRNIIFTNGNSVENVATLYSFANDGNATEDKATSMLLIFDVDGQKLEKEFKIKHNEEGYLIKAGHLYQLDVTVNVKSPEINLKVTTVKWTEHSVEVNFGKK